MGCKERVAIAFQETSNTSLDYLLQRHKDVSPVRLDLSGRTGKKGKIIFPWKTKLKHNGRHKSILSKMF